MLSKSGMKSWCWRVLLASSFFAEAAKILSCVSRDNLMDLLDDPSNPTNNWLNVVGVTCTTDEDLYLRPHRDLRTDVGSPLHGESLENQIIKSSANKTEWIAHYGTKLDSAISAKGFSNMGYPNDLFNWNNPFISGENAFPKHVLTWQGNIYLTCGAKTAYALVHPGGVKAPADFIWMSPPVKDTISEVLLAFGAYVWPDVVILDRTFSFGMVVDGVDNGIPVTPMFTKPEWDSCLAAGDLKVHIDDHADWTTAGKLVDWSSPSNMPSDAASYVTATHFADRLRVSGVAWRFMQFVDSTGAPLGDPDGGVVVTHENLICDFQKFQTSIVDYKFPTLKNMLKGATSLQSFQAAVMTLSSIKNDHRYLGCERLLMDMYETAPIPLTLENVKICKDPSVTTDPCCNKRLTWGSCCQPEETWTGNVRLFNRVAPDHVLSDIYTNIINCDFVGGSQADGILYLKAMMEEVVGPGLLESEHPATSCDAKARAEINLGDWQIKESQLNTCIERVQWGKSKIGLSSCRVDTDCYVGKCRDADTIHARCAEATGSSVGRYLIECFIDMLDPKLMAAMGKQLGIPPQHLTKDSTTDRKSTEWETEVVNKFVTAVGKPNCGGSWEGGSEGWCILKQAAPWTQARCEALAGLDIDLAWVNDDSGYGYCRNKASHEVREALRQGTSADSKCQQILGNLNGGGACFNGDVRVNQDEASCSHTWYAFSTDAKHLTLASLEYDIRDPDTGNWERQVLPGDSTRCELEKRCNWDPDNRFSTAGDQNACENPTHPYVMMQDSKHYFCGRCHGPRCYDPWFSTPPQCVVGGWDEFTCASKSGGGPESLAAVTAAYHQIDKAYMHFRCRRNSLNTKETCMHADVCPNFADSADHGMYHNCMESFCYDTVKDQSACDSTGGGWHWKSEMKRGSGLCVHYTDKSTCDGIGGNTKWWEGRAFIEGRFDTAAKCTTVCESDTGDVTTTCDPDARTCTGRCRKCYTWNTEKKLCHSDKSQSDCLAAEDDGYEWDWELEFCRKRIAENDDPDDDDFSTTCSVAASGAGHSYFSCNDFEEDACSVFCEITDKTTQATCESETANTGEWDWDRRKCLGRWHLAKTSSDCISSNFNSLTVAWRKSADDTATSQLAKKWLNCKYLDHAPCETQAECDLTGECEDWELEDGGKCVVPVAEEAGQGWTDDCSRMVHPDGAGSGYSYRHGPGRGYLCVVQHNGVDISSSTPCTTAGGSWKTRAKTLSACNSHGNKCHNVFEEWRAYGGFSTEDSCATCSNKWAKITDWRGARWGQRKAQALEWKERKFEKLNSWDVSSFDRNKASDLVKSSLAVLQGSAESSRIDCLFNPFANAISTIGAACQKIAGGSTSVANVVDVTLETVPVSRLQLAQLPDRLSGVARISTATAVLASGVDYNDFEVSKAGMVGGTSAGGGRLMRSLAVGSPTGPSPPCLKHEVIRDQYGQVYGQKVGTAIAVTGVSNAKLCITPTVPAAELCASAYPVKAMAKLKVDGSFDNSVLPEIVAEEDGQFCIDGAVDGQRYVPILRTAAFPTTTTSTTTTTTTTTTTSTTPLPPSTNFTNTTTTTTTNLPEATMTNEKIEGSLSLTFSFAGETPPVATSFQKVAEESLETNLCAEISGCSVTVTSIAWRASRRALLQEGDMRKRKLVADQTLDIDYELIVPSTTDAAAVEAMTAKATSGSSEATAFQDAMKSTVTTKIAADPVLKELSIEVKGVTVVGTPTVTTVAAPDSTTSNSRFSSSISLSLLSASLVWLFGVSFGG